MKLFLFIVFVYWLYNYWRFSQKRSYYRKVVYVAECRYRNFQDEQSRLDLATAYMQVQRYADAYDVYSTVVSPRPYSYEDLRKNMEFCKKPLPWTSGLSNHNMGYWHNFLLVRFGGQRRMMFSQALLLEIDDLMRGN